MCSQLSQGVFTYTTKKLVPTHPDASPITNAKRRLHPRRMLLCSHSALSTPEMIRSVDAWNDTLVHARARSQTLFHLSASPNASSPFSLSSINQFHWPAPTCCVADVLSSCSHLFYARAHIFLIRALALSVHSSYARMLLACTRSLASSRRARAVVTLEPVRSARLLCRRT